MRMPTALLSIGVIGAALFVRLAGWRLVDVVTPAIAAAEQPGEAQASPMRIDSLAGIPVARDAFRFARRPALVAYDPLRLAEQLAPPSPKPALTLMGLVGGADPSAVIGGLPGTDAPRVLRVGDQVGGIRVRSITGDQVRLVGMDTTWVLRMRGPWN